MKMAVPVQDFQLFNKDLPHTHRNAFSITHCWLCLYQDCDKSSRTPNLSKAQMLFTHQWLWVSLVSLVAPQNRETVGGYFINACHSSFRPWCISGDNVDLLEPVLHEVSSGASVETCLSSKKNLILFDRRIVCFSFRFILWCLIS